MFTAYLSDNLIIFIIPVNLVLAVVLSTLVGVNIALAAYTFQNKAKKMKMNNKSNILYSGGLGGATTGLLTACPICAGTFFSMIVGLVIGSSASAVPGVVTARTTLAPFQMLFILISIPTLLISPYLTIKSPKKITSSSTARGIIRHYKVTYNTPITHALDSLPEVRSYRIRLTQKWQM